MKKIVRKYSKISQHDGIGRSDHSSGSYDLWYGEPNILLNREYYRPCPEELSIPVWPYYFIENSRCDRQWFRHFNYGGLSVTLVLKGKINYIEDQRTTVVEPGEVMVQLPGCSDRMINADDCETSKLVVIFEGCAIHIFPQMFGIYTSGKIQIKSPAVIEKKMRHIGSLIESGKAGTEFELAEEGYALWLELVKQRKTLPVPADLQNLLEKLQKKNFILDYDESPAKLSGLSESTVLRLFRRHFNCTPHVFLLQKRLQYAAVLLRSGAGIKETAAQCGFTDTGYFSRCFKKQFKTVPSEFNSAKSELIQSSE